MKQRISLLLFLFFVFGSLMPQSEVIFSNLDLTKQNNLIFTASVDLPNWGSYDTVFYSSLTDKKLNQQTFFPEQVYFLPKSGELQIQNRFGVFRSDAKLQNIKAIDIFPAFVNGNEIASGKINPIVSSPDGKYLIYTKQCTAAYGDLTLYDVEKSTETVISKKYELTLDTTITIWSPDSKYFIYSTNNYMYYYSINQYLENRVISESYRQVSPGKLTCAKWNQQNNLYHIQGTMVYEISSHELFTQSLYPEILKVGKIAGKIPFKFDDNFDSFWISGDGKKILLNKGGRNLFLYYLQTEDFITTGRTISLPYLYLPRNTAVSKVIWSTNDIITVLTTGIVQGKILHKIFRLYVPDEGNVSAFTQTDDMEAQDIILSPDESKIALVNAQSVQINQYSTWTSLKTIAHSSPIAALWKNNDEILVAGYYTYRLYQWASDTSQLITLSQAEECGLSVDAQTLYCRVNGTVYAKKVQGTVWQPVAAMTVREKATASPDYRVYLEVSTRGSYKNLVMVRDIKGYGTVPLFPTEEFAYEPFRSKVESVDFQNFSHGSRIRGREVSLVFDAIDSIEGLTTILRVLADYRIRSTFFVNGEVIRRYPAAVREIAQSGHEVGSLFYISFNMTDAQFSLDKDFIKGGLARTEDDYYNATGREVSLLWHAPYYFINTAMIEASKEMNYIYVGRDVDTMDWVTKSDLMLTSGIYLPAAQLVERILDTKEPGSIIPILVGVPTGGEREDYLFQKLDLLINGLIRKGYKIVPVSLLMEHAR